MPLYFTDKKKRWPPSKPTQYVLALLALLAAVAILVGWLFLRFVFTDPIEGNDTSDNHSDTQITLPAVSYCLLMVEDADHELFAVVKADPKGERISVTPLSPSLDTDYGTLAQLLQKQGPAKAVQAVADTLNIPMVHYMSFSIADTENLFINLGESLQFTLSEPVTYKDENGASVRLAAESHKLTPKQISALLRYTDWEDPSNRDNLAADLAVALINQCLHTQSSLKGYFELLSNNSVTDLRIDQFNAYYAGLEYLAAKNEGALAQLVPLSNDTH